MEFRYMVVYEKGVSNWSVFSPDILGCGSLGDTLEETRANMREAMEFHLDETIKAGERIPEATVTTINFDEFDPDHTTHQYVIEWVAVSLPQDGSDGSIKGIHG